MNENIYCSDYIDNLFVNIFPTPAQAISHDIEGEKMFLKEGKQARVPQISTDVLSESTNTQQNKSRDTQLKQFQNKG